MSFYNGHILHSTDCVSVFYGLFSLSMHTVGWYIFIFVLVVCRIVGFERIVAVLFYAQAHYYCRPRVQFIFLYAPKLRGALVSLLCFSLLLRFTGDQKDQDQEVTILRNIIWIISAENTKPLYLQPLTHTMQQ